MLSIQNMLGIFPWHSTAPLVQGLSDLDAGRISVVFTEPGSVAPKGARNRMEMCGFSIFWPHLECVLFPFGNLFGDSKLRGSS